MSSRWWMPVGLVAQVVLLGTIPALRRAAPVARAVAIGAAAAMDAAVLAGLRRTGTARPGLADAITLARGTVACAVAGLAAADVRTPARTAGRRTPPGTRDRPGRSRWHDTAVPRTAASRTPVSGTAASPTATSAAGASGLVPLAAVALALDAVDGRVARLTRTESAFGAALDGETDAFLILVLSLYAARRHGAWVAAGGLARYAFAAAGGVLPWMRRTLPFRYWRKVATAGEGIALVAGAATFIPRPAARLALGVGLGLIAESFGRDVLWLYRRRREPR